ncbi:MAG TPA: putative Ig domain-containing protein [Candidatus Sulfopaludibacter sp.]|nr:putative Ig domain-containing protein [Candidatus Sulfopaludibacter sp.]
MFRISLFVCLVSVGSLLQAQPAITSLDASVTFGSTSLGPAITSGTALANNDFILYINGSFNPNNFSKVTWANTVTGVTQDLSFSSEGTILTTGTTQIVVAVPQSLYITTVSAPQAVNITVTEQASTIIQTSNAATFTLNPPLARPTSPLMPAGTVGVPYSGSLFTGGTGPYTVVLSSSTDGPPPNGLPLSNSQTLSGTPTQPFFGDFSILATDAWGNQLTVFEVIEIVQTPTISLVTPNSVSAGTSATAITVTGTNFVLPTFLDVGANYSGSTIVLLLPGSLGSIALPTTVVNANTAQAVIPAAYLTSAAVYGVTVVQPSNAASNSLPFAVLAPAISQVSPSPITARTTPTLVTITGSSFLAGSTILVNGSAAATTFNNAGSLSTSGVFATPNTTVTFQVANPAGSVSNIVSVSVVAPPSITSVTPNPFSGGLLTVSGLNFSNTMTVLFNGTPIPTTFGSATRLTASVPSSLFNGSGTSALIAVQTVDGYVTPATSIILTPLRITTASLPNATGLQPYSATLTATGGSPAYSWSVSGLPAGLTYNSSTGAISGTPTAFGSFPLLISVTDGSETTVNARITLTVSAPAPPPQVTSGTLPPGFVNVSYNASIPASGGNGSLTFGQGGGNLPPGLNLDSNGVLRGLPTTAGTYRFTVVVTDADGLTGSGDFTLVIQPQPLSIITSSPLPNVVVGGLVTVKFTAFGGVPPYSFTSTNLPPGTSLATDGTLSGTATTVGTFPFSVTVSDKGGSTPSTKSFSLTVTPGALTVQGTFVDGQVGVAYSASVSASGGTQPYTLSVTGLPDGVTFAGGNVAGTPTTAGKYTITATVTDAKGGTASQTFTVNIAAPGPAITTASLPNGTVNVAYSASLAASGGTGALTWSVSGLPGGVTATSGGAISGTPTAAGSFSVSATVTDSKGVKASKTFSITISAAVLSITTTTLDNATAGIAYAASVAATGGVTPYTFSASGLPAGLTMSSSGAISGTTVAAGPATVTVTVKDGSGTTASQNLTLTVVLPPTPALTVTGLPPTSTPATQSTVQIGLGASYPVAVTVNLTLTFAADNGPDDPTVQFATGGRTAQLTIPAGTTAALNTIGLQTGTVAGTATITARLRAGTQDITPTPAPTFTVRINSVAPVATTVTAASTSTGFTVTVTGYATARRVTQAIFVFTAAAGANLQTTTVTIPVDTVFAAWYASAGAAAFGSQFIYTQPFTVSGGAASVASVTVTLVNGDGSSTPVTAAVK